MSSETKLVSDNIRRPSQVEKTSSIQKFLRDSAKKSLQNVDMQKKLATQIYIILSNTGKDFINKQAFTDDQKAVMMKMFDIIEKNNVPSKAIDLLHKVLDHPAVKSMVEKLIKEFEGRVDFEKMTSDILKKISGGKDNTVYSRNIYDLINITGGNITSPKKSYEDKDEDEDDDKDEAYWKHKYMKYKAKYVNYKKKLNKYR
jgi:hypothetical protein